MEALLIAGRDLPTQEPAFRHAVAATAAPLIRAARRIGLTNPGLYGSPPRLAPREVEALYWVFDDLSDKAIAKAMNLSPETVAGYLQSARKKLDATSRLSAARRAEELGLLPLWPPPASRRSRQGPFPAADRQDVSRP